MPLTDLNDAKYWQDRAAEMRALAEGMKDSDAATTALNLAKIYDKLGDQAEARAKSGVDFFSIPGPLLSPVSKSKE
jgi:hypothetical protein